MKYNILKLCYHFDGCYPRIHYALVLIKIPLISQVIHANSEHNNFTQKSIKNMLNLYIGVSSISTH